MLANEIKNIWDSLIKSLPEKQLQEIVMLMHLLTCSREEQGFHLSKLTQYDFDYSIHIEALNAMKNIYNKCKALRFSLLFDILCGNKKYGERSLNELYTSIYLYNIHFLYWYIRDKEEENLNYKGNNN